MIAEAIFLTRPDASALSEMLRWWRGQRGNRPLPRAEPEVPPDVWMVLVRTPADGIPGAWDDQPGTGTYGDTVQGTGTGTAVADEGDRPGYADCEVFRLLRNTDSGRALSRPRMFKVSPSTSIGTIRVYNLSITAVNGNQFVTALRDGYGDWFVPSLGYLFRSC